MPTTVSVATNSRKVAARLTSWVFSAPSSIGPVVGSDSTTETITEPEMILYDGTTDDANVIGLSYYLLHGGPAEPTQGFTGNNDHFHRHDGLCIGATGVIGTDVENCVAALAPVRQTRSYGRMPPARTRPRASGRP